MELTKEDWLAVATNAAVYATNELRARDYRQPDLGRVSAELDRALKAINEAFKASGE